jgi:hypothetical protein
MRHAQCLPLSAAGLLAMTAMAGATKLKVTYAGSGDSGSIDEVQFLDAGGKVMTLATDWQVTTYRGQVARESSLSRTVEALVDAMLPSGFEINEGGSGIILVNLAKRTMQWEHVDNGEDISTYDSEGELIGDPVTENSNTTVFDVNLVKDDWDLALREFIR